MMGAFGAPVAVPGLVAPHRAAADPAWDPANAS